MATSFEPSAFTTGEENEDVLLYLRAKLYRFDKESNQWKERGVGNMKILKHQETGNVRLVMRQNRTLIVRANHLVLPNMVFLEHGGNDTTCVWYAADFSDGELKDETFCVRFPSIENCKDFKRKISLHSQSNDGGEAEIAAELIE